ncbi:MAG: PAS domain S-box protein [Myxococcales bacterium]|nr:PAS domain S-box protein [Myxococcales bacterium]
MTQRHVGGASIEDEQVGTTVASALLHEGPAAVLAVDRDGAIVFSNQQAARLFGYRRQELHGEPIETLVPDGFRSHHEALRKRYQIEPRRRPMGDEGNLEGRRSNGTVFPVEVDLLPVVRGNTRWIVATVVDVSARQRTRHALRISEERLRRAQRVAQVGFWDWNIATGELYWSDEIFAIFGINRSMFAATYDSFVEAVHPEDRSLVQQAVDSSINDGAPYSVDHRVIRPSGEVRYVLEQGEVTRDVAGTPIRMLGTVHDVTERRALEQKLLHSQKMEAFGRLAGGIAHDFNNLLAVIVNHIVLAKDEIGQQPEPQQRMDNILETCTHATRLVRQLLAFSRKSVVRTKPLCLNDTVRQVSAIASQAIPKHIELVVRLEEQPWTIKADPVQMEQLVLNLLVNARDAMAKPGHLRLETCNTSISETQREPAAPAALAPGDYVCLTVSDSGEGMSEAVMQRVFEPFFTTKGPEAGTGLGLATCYDVVNHMGGHIDVASELGKGSTFRVFMPGFTQPAEPEQAQPKQATKGGTEDVLLVEDNDQLRGLLADVLRRSGYRVRTASDGLQAQQLLRSERAPVDIVVTDVVMPNLRGPELARSLSTAPAGTSSKVLFISGYTDDALSMYGALPPGTELLNKPFQPDELVRRVREILDR